jgi:predicted house-cleaning noncanonical NTP pyrophosphatase (MazG superfamily)
VEKLVRDRIPELIRASGTEPKVRLASADEMLALLMRKLQEEVDELKAEPGIDELVDVAEVLARIATQLKIDPSTLVEARVKKAQTHGRFNEGIVLIRN